MVKNITLILIAVLLAFAGYFGVKQYLRVQHEAQLVLAGELNKAMTAMMYDFVKTQAKDIHEVEADGKWYPSIRIISGNRIELVYTVKDNSLIRQWLGFERVVAGFMDKVEFRRLPADPEILEVKINVRNTAHLTSNFKIRLKN